MISRIYASLFFSIVLAASGAFFIHTAAAGTPGAVHERKIITYRNGVSDTEKNALLGHARAVTIKHLTNNKNSVALLDADGVRVMESDPRVLRVEDDVIAFALGKVEAAGKGAPAPVQPAEVLPWGIDRIGAPAVWSATMTVPTTGTGIRVAVIDTGIELAHPDLAANIKGSYNAISPTKSANDDNGHGTHVAGIIGALDNTIGVVGTAPTADLYAVKVLNRNGSGYISDIIEGIDWAVARNINVINMSLGASSDVQALHDAVIRAHNAGIVVVAAAGNDSGGAVNFPGAYPEVIAVSATDSNNTIASFSSVGPEVDLAAPGAAIYSTYKGQTYRTLSGTSMASPHVAGGAALLLSVPAKCDTDLSGACSPDEVKARLETTALDLGAVGQDNQYGAGLLNIWSAMQ